MQDTTQISTQLSATQLLSFLKYQQVKPTFLIFRVVVSSLFLIRPIFNDDAVTTIR